ncbi:GlsB/YeaQ/YmgE family stress response membrane protein [Arthrobacter globiformis]|uniref:DUF308 domain-containing protein n=1 Tax=Arthrobacter globiformis TaxID=1665 RepID=A0A328HGF7_ARTGO|nr:GlsB/YeaQ/YmgE family stress response membrane protein [Arthrobacter globiformis]RAM37572.1 hypothetical protein DBZ45_09525 [Arthrobacter globiformis]
MNRPDSNASDPSANQDDAVWLDLVARLQGDSPAPDADVAPGDGEPRPTKSPRHHGGPRHSAAPSDNRADDAGSARAEEPDAGSGPGSAARRFTDFDPLGLAPRAPRELSAAERQQAADQEKATGQEKADRSGQPDVPPGAGDPRDYSVEDDDGEFVPEEPPKLSATDPLTMLAWLGAVGAPVALVLSSMFWRSAPLLAILGMVAAFIGAVVYLIMKLPQEKDENDDGARV